MVETREVSVVPVASAEEELFGGSELGLVEEPRTSQSRIGWRLKRCLPVTDVVSPTGAVVVAVVEEMTAVVLRDWTVVEDIDTAVEVEGGDGGGYP